VNSLSWRQKFDVSLFANLVGQFLELQRFRNKLENLRLFAVAVHNVGSLG
jgi:hypothetical protein